MAVGDVFKLSVVGTYGLGQQFVNTLHYRQEVLVVGSEAQDLANQWANEVLPLYVLLLVNSSIVDTIEVRQITGDPLTGYDAAVNTLGTLVGDQLPPQTCPLISWRTGFLGRRNRGRMYLPAPTEGMQNAGALTVPYIETAQNFADACHQLQVLGVTQWQQVIYGYPDPEADPPLAEHIVEVTTGLIRQDMATQRRRRVGTGS